MGPYRTPLTPLQDAASSLDRGPVQTSAARDRTGLWGKPHSGQAPYHAPVTPQAQGHLHVRGSAPAPTGSSHGPGSQHPSGLSVIEFPGPGPGSPGRALGSSLGRQSRLTCALPHLPPTPPDRRPRTRFRRWLNPPAACGVQAEGAGPGGGGGALDPRAAFWDVKSSRGARAVLGSGVRGFAASWGTLPGRWPQPP